MPTNITLKQITNGIPLMYRWCNMMFRVAQSNEYDYLEYSKHLFLLFLRPQNNSNDTL
jgi:hypothetical protein